MLEAGCAAIVLAAGASTRLGQPKQLIQFNGESILHRTSRLAISAGCSPVFVVVGFEAERMQREIVDLNATAIFNAVWQSGMGSSLRCGVEAAEGVARVLLLLSDQPRLSLEVLQALLQVNTDAGSLITASSYANKLGVPAIFRKALYPDLKNIEGDKGARQVIEQHRRDATSVDFPDGAIDLDTVEDLASLRARSQQ